jgi:ATP-binding cassette, subfamily B, multidrug efflux pump
VSQKATLRQTVEVLGPYLRRYRRGLTLGFASLLFKVVAATCNPYILGQGFDLLSHAFEWTSLAVVIVLMLLVSAFRGFMQYHMRVILVGISRDVEFDIRNDLFAHMTLLNGSFYQQLRTGDLMARATNDLNQVRMMLGPGLMYWVETVLTTVLAMSVMLSVDWKLTLIVMLPLPLVSFVVVYFGQKIHKRFQAIQEQFSDLSSRAQENLSGVRIVRAYAQEEAEIAKFESLNRDYIRANMGLVRDTGVFNPLLQTLVGVTFLLVLWAGVSRLNEGKITLGAFVMFQSYMGMLIWPMIAFGWVINLSQRGSASLTRLQEILEAKPAILPPPVPTPVVSPCRGGLRFENVTLRFGEVTALDSVNLEIPAGKTVAIVGRTGSGKSTLLNLIPRLLDPSEGRILLDGVDLRQLDPGDLRQQIGFVPQETFLFSTTLEDNIAFGVKQASPEEVEAAAAKAGLATDVAAFPDGFATKIGERGITLSGGQKQRTAIARAILRSPAILILDDALSSVDTITEETILHNLAGVMAGRTAIFVSHRVSTVKEADLIFVLEKGRIVEQGSHAELITRGGYYAELSQRQTLEEELEQVS